MISLEKCWTAPIRLSTFLFWNLLLLNKRSSPFSEDTREKKTEANNQIFLSGRQFSRRTLKDAARLGYPVVPGFPFAFITVTRCPTCTGSELFKRGSSPGAKSDFAASPAVPIISLRSELQPPRTAGTQHVKPQMKIPVLLRPCFKECMDDSAHQVDRQDMDQITTKWPDRKLSE